MATIAAQVTQAISAVAPVDGVSIGKVTDKSTWRVDYSAGATQQQKTAAQAAITAFDVAVALAAPSAPTADDQIAALWNAVNAVATQQPLPADATTLATAAGVSLTATIATPVLGGGPVKVGP